MTDSSEGLISDLVEDLVPVRPLPRLRQAFAVILTLWAIVLGVILWAKDGAIGVSSIAENRLYLSAFLGLLIASLGGTLSALAASVPGRERLEIAGSLLAVFGLGAAAVACFLGIGLDGLPSSLAPVAADRMCFEESAFLSLLPAGVILSFLVRGWAARPIRASLIALIASGALGSLIVHTSCSYMAPRHLLISHLSVPFVLALLGFYPLAILLRKIRG